MQVDKEMNVMFATKKITSIVRNLVSRASSRGLIAYRRDGRHRAAARPVVVSTIPADDAITCPSIPPSQ